MAWATMPLFVPPSLSAFEATHGMARRVPKDRRPQDHAQGEQVPMEHAASTPFNYKEFVKDLFDHFRNLGICSAIFVAGKALVHHPQWLNTKDDFSFLGWSNILLAVILVLLNAGRFVAYIHGTFDNIRSSYPGQSYRASRAGRGAALLELLILSWYLLTIVSIAMVSIHLQLVRLESRS